MKKNSLLATFVLPFLFLFLLPSCKKEVSSPSDDQITNTGAAAGKSAKAMNDLAKSVRNATAKYHSTKQAIAAGYVPDDHCVSVPGMGGMGYHWVNPTMVDPVFDPLQPEAILYAKGPGGNLRMVAVEYIVIDIGQDRPMFGDQPFDVGGTPVAAPHWSLHVWLYEHNPSGLFNPFNPNVSCP